MFVGPEVRPSILRHMGGLAARPPMRYTLRVVRSGFTSCRSRRFCQPPGRSTDARLLAANLLHTAYMPLDRHISPMRQSCLIWLKLVS
ncbi:protein of unknown function [Streptomyces sp. KY75]|nr:protein of unknown function [Streptomyces sp. KY75]CAD5989019.1 protein of unknown function [Streptomyces sp. KY70]